MKKALWKIRFMYEGPVSRKCITEKVYVVSDFDDRGGVPKKVTEYAQGIIKETKEKKGITLSLLTISFEREVKVI